MSTPAQHRRIDDFRPNGRGFVYCGCGWSSGPNFAAELELDHEIHVEQRCDLPHEDDDDPPDDGTQTLTLEQYRAGEHLDL